MKVVWQRPKVRKGLLLDVSGALPGAQTGTTQIEQHNTQVIASDQSPNLEILFLRCLNLSDLDGQSCASLRCATILHMACSCHGNTQTDLALTLLSSEK